MPSLGENGTEVILPLPAVVETLKSDSSWALKRIHKTGMVARTSQSRVMAGFQYIGPVPAEEAERLGVTVAGS